MALLERAGVTARGAPMTLGRWLAWWRASLSAAERSPHARLPLPVKRVVIQATSIWLVTRLLFIAITALASVFGFTLARPTTSSLFSANPQNARYLLPLLAGHPFLAQWVHWDASWYLLIGTQGYTVTTPIASGFFPLYPLQIHLVTLLLGPGVALPAALALANLASLAGFIGTGLVGAHEALRDESATNASARLIQVTAAYPFAYYLFAPFTEGFFLACVVFSLLCARRGWWRSAALIALLAGLTRPTALALVPALAWEYGRQHGAWRRESWRGGAWRSPGWLRALAGGAVVAAAGPLGLLSYLIYQKQAYGHFTAPFTAQSAFHGHLTWPPWSTLHVLIERALDPAGWTPPYALLYLDGGLLILFLVITLLNAHRLPLLYTLYMLATFGILLLSPVPHLPDLVSSAGRYLLVATPVFLLLARWTRRWPWLETVVIGGGFALQALLVVLFLNSVWIE